jgi:MFS transporter, FSR family, fosmidomycin resistance protein
MSRRANHGRRSGTGAIRSHQRAFAIFYTGTIGAGATAPILFGMLGDAVGSHGAMMATAITAAAILPLAIALAPRLPAGASAHRD